MEPRQTRKYAWLMVALVGLNPVMGVSQQDDYITHATAPDRLLLSYHLHIPEMAEQDPAPLLRVYGDGRVVVFHPAYMKQAGRYELRLSGAELQALLLDVAAALSGFEADEVRLQKHIEDQARWQALDHWREAVLRHDSDADISHFYLDVEAFRPADGGQAVSLQATQVSWSGLRHDARDYPGIDKIQDLRQAEAALEALAASSALVRTGDTP